MAAQMKIIQLTSQNVPINYYRHWQYAHFLNQRGHTILAKPDRSLEPFGYKNTTGYVGDKDYTLDYQWLDTIVPDMDAVWSTVTYEPERLACLLAAREAYGKPFIIDTDDLVSEIPDYNTAGEKLRTNSDRVKIARAGFRHADAITTTCEFLRSKLLQYNSNVVVTPNCIDPDLWYADRKEKPASEIRILWAGSAARYGDIQLIRKPLETIVSKFKSSGYKLKLIFINTVPDFAVEWVEDGTAYVVQWAGMVDYNNVLRHISPDIGLAPLISSDFNRSKSPLKYFDYAMMGCAGIYSDECTYYPVKHGITGMMAQSESDWTEYMEQLIVDRNLREGIARASHDDVMANHNIHKTIPAIEATLKETLDAIRSVGVKSNSHRPSSKPVRGSQGSGRPDTGSPARL